MKKNAFFAVCLIAFVGSFIVSAINRRMHDPNVWQSNHQCSDLPNGRHVICDDGNKHLSKSLYLERGAKEPYSNLIK